MLIGKFGHANAAIVGKFDAAEQHEWQIAARAAMLSTQIRPAKFPKISVSRRLQERQ
jgi:hypothetical protein